MPTLAELLYQTRDLEALLKDKRLDSLLASLFTILSAHLPLTQHERNMYSRRIRSRLQALDKRRRAGHSIQDLEYIHALLPSPLRVFAVRVLNTQSPLGRLQSTETPWEKRLQLLDHLQNTGWADWPYWSRVAHALRYAGTEWQVPLSSEDLTRLDQATTKEQTHQDYLDALCAIVKPQLEQRPELSERILHDSATLDSFIVWGAFQVWWQTEVFYKWTDATIVEPAVKSFRGPFMQPHDLRAEGYLHLIQHVILPGIRRPIKNLEAYWRQCVKNYVCQCLKQEGKHTRAIISPISPCTSTDDEKSPHQDIEAIEDAHALMAFSQLEDAEALRVLAQQLTTRQRRILWFKGPDEEESNPVIAAALGLSLSTVEKELRQIRNAARRIGLRPH